MKIEYIIGDILDVPVEGLLSTGNVSMNMSGGINGALMMKYGTHLQDELHAYLKEHALKTVDPGFIHLFKQPIAEYTAVVYAVGIDGWYESSVKLVRETLLTSLSLLKEAGCTSVAMGAMATGFGKLSKNDFGFACAEVLHDEKELEEVFIVERNEIGMEEIRKGMGTL